MYLITHNLINKQINQKENNEMKKDKLKIVIPGAIIVILVVASLIGLIVLAVIDNSPKDNGQAPDEEYTYLIELQTVDEEGYYFNMIGGGYYMDQEMIEENDLQDMKEGQIITITLDNQDDFIKISEIR